MRDDPSLLVAPSRQIPKPAKTQLIDIVFPTLKAATDRMFDLGIEAAPHEACGLLVREGENEFRVIEMINRANDPSASYRIDSETIRTLSIKPDHWAHVGIWHTHPGGLVGPSAGDLKYRQDNVKYLVVTIPTGEVVWF